MKPFDFNSYCLHAARPIIQNFKLGLIFHYPTEVIAKSLLPKAAKAAGIPVSEYRNRCDYQYLIMDIDDACTSLIFEFKQMIKSEEERSALVQDFIKLYGHNVEIYEKMINDVSADIDSGNVNELIHFSLGIPNQTSALSLAGIKFARQLRKLVNIYDRAFEEIYADVPADKKPGCTHDHVRDFVLRQQKRNSKKVK